MNDTQDLDQLHKDRATLLRCLEQAALANAVQEAAIDKLREERDDAREDSKAWQTVATFLGEVRDKTVAERDYLKQLADYLDNPQVLLQIPQPHRLRISELLHGKVKQDG